MQLAPGFRQTLARLLETRLEIRFAILYGSAAEGGRFQDVDIALFMDRSMVPPAADLDYEFSLASELERAVPCPVDVRIINDAPLPFCYQVSRGVALLVHDRPAFYHFLERTWDMFLDFEPVAMQYLKEQR